MSKNHLLNGLLIAGLSVSTALAQSTPATGTAGQQRQNQTPVQGQTGPEAHREGQQQAPRAGERATRPGQSTGSHVAGAAGDAESMVGQNERKFMNKAASGSLMEVRMAELAMEKSNNEAIKDYARKLKEDHQKANEKLKEIAEERNVDLPSEPAPEHQQQVTKMQNMAADQFDRAFMRTQVQHHKKDIKEFEKQSKRSMDTDLKEFASSTLPTLQEHLRMAQDIQGEGTRSRTVPQQDADQPKTQPRQQQQEQQQRRTQPGTTQPTNP